MSELVLVLGIVAGLCGLCGLTVWWVWAFANAIEREARKYREGGGE